MVLDENIKAFVVYVVFFTLKMLIHPARKAHIALFIAKKVNVSAECLDFTNVFSKESAKILPKCTNINNHTLKLEDGKQPPYKPIYSLGPVKLKTLKTYIKINLANGFIQLLKYPTSAPILFICKSNNSLQLYISYWGLNNLTNKNQYRVPLIGKSLNWLRQAKHFT